MSKTTSRGHQETNQREDRENTVAAPQPQSTRRRRGGWVAAGLVVVLAAAVAGAAWYAGAFSPGSSSRSGQGAEPAPATRTVTRQNLASRTPVDATLGYAGSYTVRGHGGGTLTWLPSQGQVIRQGQVLYKTDDGNPVVLLYGGVPVWRSMSEGTTGSDVTQLNHDLVALGDASSSTISALGWDYYSWETQYAVERMEDHLGVSNPSGSLSLGSVVFEPGALRVSSVQGSWGGPASGPVLAATSDQHVVTINLSTSQESEVKAGDSVMVSLPDGSTTAGRISSVGAVASGSGSNATIPVTVTLSHPSAAGKLDQAPVTVYITTATASNVLTVPVGALLAQSSGGYAVEVVGAGNTRHLVPVMAGPVFDDNAGLVEVSGALTPGERVVVPAS